VARLRRDHFSDENVSRFVAFLRAQGVRVPSDEEREAGLRATLAAAPRDEHVFVFGYGSLLWNPAFHHEEARPARLHGWHRRFCLWNTFGRGTKEAPGLMLALDRGGACHGLALRLAPDAVESELRVLWNREMLSGGYTARWTRPRTRRGAVAALTFVANRASDRYAGRLGGEEVARRVGAARGPLGSNRDYVEELDRKLAELGLRDRSVSSLAAALRALGG
jgi:cation transport protein ChaC